MKMKMPEAEHIVITMKAPTSEETEQIIRKQKQNRSSLDEKVSKFRDTSITCVLNFITVELVLA
jgi:hypothetical protein